MKKVTLLASPFSPYYGMAKEFLNEKSIKYQVIVNEDEKKFEKITGQKGELQFLIQELDENNNVTNQEVVIGMDKEKLNQAI